MILLFPIVSDEYIQLLIELSLTVKCMRPMESRRREIAVFHFKFAGRTGLEPADSRVTLFGPARLRQLWKSYPGDPIFSSFPASSTSSPVIPPSLCVERSITSLL